MKHSSARRSNLFLMEMILAILFFALASMVCMKLFAAAHDLSRKTSDSNFAMTAVKSAVSYFEAGDGSLESLMSAYPDSTSEDSTLTVYYDKNQRLCTQSEAFYRIKVTIKSSSEQLTVATITAYDSGQEELFALDASCYQPIKVGD